MVSAAGVRCRLDNLTASICANDVAAQCGRSPEEEARKNREVHSMHFIFRESTASRSPSTAKLIENHSEDCTARKRRSTRRNLEVVFGAEQDSSPRRNIGWEAQPKKR